MSPFKYPDCRLLYLAWNVVVWAPETITNGAVSPWFTLAMKPRLYRLPGASPLNTNCFIADVSETPDFNTISGYTPVFSPVLNPSLLIFIQLFVEVTENPELVPFSSRRLLIT